MKNIQETLARYNKVAAEINPLKAEIKEFCFQAVDAFTEFGPEDKNSCHSGDETDFDRIDYTIFTLDIGTKVIISFFTEPGWGRKNYHHDEMFGSYTFNLDILEFANQPNGFENYFSSQFGLAEKLYNAYGYSANWKNFSGGDMPQWLVLPDKIKDHWRAVAYSTLTLKLDNK